ncbi:hypothetical protein Hanom_Chr12g01122061 [Helianthus anomalus]
MVGDEVEEQEEGELTPEKILTEKGSGGKSEGQGCRKQDEWVDTEGLWEGESEPQRLDSPMQDVHGNQEQPLEFPMADVAVEPTPNFQYENNTNGPVSELGQGNNFNKEGFSGIGGPTPLSTLGKRPRDTRSPPSVGSTQGPPIRIPSQRPDDSNISINLNRVADGFTEDVSGADGYASQSSVEYQEEFGEPIESRRLSQANPEPGQNILSPIAKEIDATKEIHYCW